MEETLPTVFLLEMAAVVMVLVWTLAVPTTSLSSGPTESTHNHLKENPG